MDLSFCFGSINLCAGVGQFAWTPFSLSEGINWVGEYGSTHCNDDAGAIDFVLAGIWWSSAI